MCGILVWFAELTVCLPTTLCRSGPCSGQPDVKHGTVSYMWVVTCHNGMTVQFQPQTAAVQNARRSSPRYWSRIAELSPCTWHVYSAYLKKVIIYTCYFLGCICGVFESMSAVEYTHSNDMLISLRDVLMEAQRESRRTYRSTHY